MKVLEYRQFCLIPEELRPHAVSKDYGVCEDTGRSLVVYMVDIKELPERLQIRFDDVNKCRG